MLFIYYCKKLIFAASTGLATARARRHASPASGCKYDVNDNGNTGYTTHYILRK